MNNLDPAPQSDSSHPGAENAGELERLRVENQALQAENERLRREHEAGESLTMQRRVVIWALRCLVTFLVGILLEELIHELFSPETIQRLEKTSGDFIAAIVRVNPLTIAASFLGALVQELFGHHNLNPFGVVWNAAIAAVLTASSEGTLAGLLVAVALVIGFYWAWSSSHESFVATLILGPLLAFVMLLLLMLVMVIFWLLFVGGIRAIGAMVLITSSLPIIWHYLLLTLYKRTSMDFEDRIAERLIHLV